MAAKKNVRVKPGTSRQQAEQRRLAFVEAYISNGGNGTQAAIVAGYSPKSATITGSKLLTDPKVSGAIKERQAFLANKHELTTDSVIAELSKIVHADPRRMFDLDGGMLPPDKWPDDMAGVISSVEVEELWEGAGPDRTQVGTTKKFKMWDKNAAIEKAMKHLGLFAQDNRQKGLLADLPREMVKDIVSRLKGEK